MSSYNFTLIINGDNIELEPMNGNTKLQDLLVTIQRKSGIPPARQQIMSDSANIDIQRADSSLSQLHIPVHCHLLVLDANPDAALEILPSPPQKPVASPAADTNKSSNTSNSNDDDNDVVMQPQSTDDNKEEKESKQPHEQNMATAMAVVEDEYDYEFPAFVFPEDEAKIDGELIAVHDIDELLLVLFGANSNPQDVDRWYAQGLGFTHDRHDDNSAQHNNDIRFGLLQIHGGPCGVLAPVQAYVMKAMLFDKSIGVILDDGAEMPVLPTNEQRTEALICAMVRIVLKAACDETYITWIVAAERHSRRYFRKIIKGGEPELRATIAASMDLLQSRIGVISFVLSVLLSRSLPIVLEEMDDKSQSLILPEFGHCSQELVNLMITGRCVTNIHDGDKVLGDPSDPDTFILKGIGPNQEIGFLTTLEPMRLAKVGDHYKCPQFPIWVVGSSSHYTTLFTLNLDVAKITEFDKKSQELRRQFHVFDVEESGIIKSKDLGSLLNNLKSDVKAYQISQHFHTGEVILWADFERIWKMLENQENYGWHCLSCTLWNKMEATLCEVCAAMKGDAIIEEKTKSHKEMEKNLQNKANNNGGNGKQEADAEPANPTNEVDTKPPTKFFMYLYNGLKATKKDRPQITKLSVWTDGELQQFHSESEELQALIRCKFPYAIVEYAGSYITDLH